MELIKSPVVFEEEQHKYTLGERELSGITKLISRHLFPDKYKDIPEAILNAAAERGSLIHKEVEDWLINKEFGFTDELYAFKQSGFSYEKVYPEFLVNNDKYATKIDIVAIDSSTVDLYDIKTTYNLDKDYLSWQLSIDAYLFEHMTNYPVNKLGYIWLRGDKCEIGDIVRKSDKEVEDLLNAESNCEIYTQELILPQAEMAQIIKLESYIKTLDEQKKKAEAEAKEFKQKLITAMEARGIKKLSLDNLSITYVAPTKKISIDSKRLKEELPEIAKSYMQESNVKASVRITIKEAK